jgi:hypothetical protein
MNRFARCVAAAMLITVAHSASATLMVDIVGISGSGVTTWTLSGDSTTTVDGAIRTNGSASFGGGDSWEASASGDYIADVGLQDVVLAIIGTPIITIGGVTETITGIFLDDDGGSFDDMGIRVANQLNYAAGLVTSWSGIFTVALDIDSLNVGTYVSAGAGGTGGYTGPFFSAESDTIINIAFGDVAVPEPVTTSLLAVGFGLFGFARRRHAAA